MSRTTPRPFEIRDDYSERLQSIYLKPQYTRHPRNNSLGWLVLKPAIRNGCVHNPIFMSLQGHLTYTVPGEGRQITKVDVRRSTKSTLSYWTITSMRPCTVKGIRLLRLTAWRNDLRTWTSARPGDHGVRYGISPFREYEGDYWLQHLITFIGWLPSSVQWTI